MSPVRRALLAVAAVLSASIGCAFDDLDHLSSGEDTVELQAEDECPSSHLCVAPTPVGWSGPAVLYLGDGADPMPECDARWPTMRATAGSGALEAAPAGCSACTCTPPTEPCSLPDIHLYGFADCKLTLGAKPSPPGVCFAAENVIPSGFVDPPTPVVSACVSTPQVASKPAASWEKRAVVCEGASAAGSCGTSGGSCFAVPEAPFGGRVCVVHDGDVACPAGDYVHKTVLHMAEEDTRDCTKCACGDAAVSCSGTISLYDADDACESVPFVSAPADGVCVNVGVEIKSYRYDGSAEVSCGEASGGEPTGTVRPAQPMTACCTQ